jgi:hypothetical protein
MLGALLRYGMALIQRPALPVIKTVTIVIAGAAPFCR